jgi:hypothetical protein
MAGNQVYLLILVNFHAPRSGSVFPVRIQGCIPNYDPNPDPGQPNQCGSMGVRIRIHNTVSNFMLRQWT